MIDGLFVLCILLLAIYPQTVNRLYSSFYGRLVLLFGLVALTARHELLGLLGVLCLVSSINQFGSFTGVFVEGFDTIIGEDNVDTSGGQPVLTKGAVDAKKQRISELKAKLDTDDDGVDKEDIKAAIMAKESNTIPVDPAARNNDAEVQAFTTASSLLRDSSQF